MSSHEEPSTGTAARRRGQRRPPAGDAQAIEKLRRARKILAQLSQVIVGQHEVIEELLISLFSRGPLPAGRRARAGQDADDQHAGRTLNLTFSRIQFTPDLMPADITGTEIIEENRATGQPRVTASWKARCSPT